MSLINQMLQDLDKRGVAINPVETGPAMVRAIPDTSFDRSGSTGLLMKILIASVIVIVAGVAVWMNWRPVRPVSGITASVTSAQKKSADVPVVSTTTPASASLAKTVAAAVATTASAGADTAPLSPVEKQLNTDTLPPLSSQLLHLKMSSDLDAMGRWAIAEKNARSQEADRNNQRQQQQATRLAPSSASGNVDGRTLTGKTNLAPAAPSSTPVTVPITSTTPLAVSATNTVATIVKTVKEITPQQQADNEYRQARALLQQGRNADAIASLEQVMKFDPQHAAARQTLISILIDSKRHEEAMRWLQSGLALDKSQVNLAMILARLQVEKVSVPSAIETLQRSVSYAAERADYLAFLAALQQREGRHKDAADLYLSALKKNPQSGVWWMGLGISLQADGRSGEAAEAFQRAKSSNSLSPELQAYVEQRITQLHTR